MTTRNLKLAFDIGGSSLRIIDEEKYITKFPSQYIEMDKKEYIVDKTKDDDLIDLRMRLSDGTVIRKRIIVDKSMMQYAKSKVELLNNKPKTKSEELFVLLAVSMHAYLKENCSNVTNIILNKAVVLLPPSEAYSEALQEFKRKFADAEIELKYPKKESGKKITIEVKEIVVVPEGITAMWAMDDKSLEEIGPRYSLLVDTGKRSTDMALVVDGDLYNGATSTYDIAGLTLEALIGLEFSRKGKDLSTVDIIEIITTGKYHKDTDVTDILNKCKENFMKMLHDRMSQLCNAAAGSTKIIDNIVLFGRVFNDAPGSKKMSKILQELMPDVKIFSQDDGLMNIRGAGSLLDE